MLVEYSSNGEDWFEWDDALILPVGTYQIRVTFGETLNFKKHIIIGEFEVTAHANKRLDILPYIVMGAALVLTFLFFILLKRRKDKEEEEEKPAVA